MLKTIIFLAFDINHVIHFVSLQWHGTCSHFINLTNTSCSKCLSSTTSLYWLYIIFFPNTLMQFPSVRTNEVLEYFYILFHLAFSTIRKSTRREDLAFPRMGNSICIHYTNIYSPRLLICSIHLVTHTEAIIFIYMQFWLWLI